jgi:hypothetical protein
MFSSLPKLVDKNFVIGFFFPALLAILAAAWAFPSLSVLDPVRSLSASEKILGNLTYLALIVWGIAIFLMTANYTFYRMLEGYLPPLSWITPLWWWHRLRFRRLKRRYDSLMNDWQTATDNGFVFASENVDKISALRRNMLSSYPTFETEVMPTYFGNIIRSFEVYPRQIYGADGVPVWLRLASVMPKDFTGLVDSARAQVDCFVNLTYLALFLALTALTFAAYDMNWDLIPHWSAFGPAGHRYLEVGAVSIAFAGFAYRWASSSVIAWGDLVKSAFDCYLPALTKQLGFAMPLSEKERQEFWREFNALVLYQQPMTVGRWSLVSDHDEGVGREHIADMAGSENGADEQKVANGPEDKCCRNMKSYEANVGEADAEKITIC